MGGGIGENIFILFYFILSIFWPCLRYGEVLGPGTEPTPQQ